MTEGPQNLDARGDYRLIPTVDPAQTVPADAVAYRQELVGMLCSTGLWKLYLNVNLQDLFTKHGHDTWDG